MKYSFDSELLSSIIAAKIELKSLIIYLTTADIINKNFYTVNKPETTLD